MPFDGQAISRQTYRHGMSRGAKSRRSNNSFISTGLRDSSWLIPLYSPGAVRIQVSPDPDTDMDRDVLAGHLFSTTQQDVIVDRALRGSGGSTSMLKATGVNLDSAFTSGTISFWIYQEDLGVNPAINKSSSSTNFVQTYLTSQAGTSRLHINSRIAAGTSNIVYGDTAILAQTWTHCVITSSGTAWVMYVNGVLQTLTVDSGSNTGDWFGDVASGTTVRVGANVAESSFIEGAFDEVFTSSAVATVAQVLALTNSGRGVLAKKALGSFPAITHYWSCSTNHTAVGHDRVGGVTLTTSGLVDTAGIPQSTLGQDRAVLFIGDTSTDLSNQSVNLRAGDLSGSLSIWVYFASAGQEAILTKNDNTASNKWELYRDSATKIRISSTIGGAQDEVQGNTTIGQGVWAHVILVSTGTAWSMYVNNTLQTLTTTAGSNSGEWLGDVTGTEFEVGGQQGVVTSLDGRLDELGFWTTQFTETNRTFLYNSGSGRHFQDAVTITGAVHYWSFSLHHGGIGFDRLGGVTLTATDSVYDAAGIAGQAEAWINQFVLGIRNNEGFLELKTDSGMPTFRVDDTGIRWEFGGQLTEATDGAFTWTIGGSDPDWTLQTYDTTILFYDDSLAEVVVLNSIAFEATLGGTITFESGSFIQEQADGELIVRAIGSDADVTIGSNTHTSAIFHDRSAGSVIIMSDVTITGDLGGKISFAGGDFIQEEADGSLRISILGSDADLQIDSNTLTNTVFYDRSAGTIMFLGTKIRMDSTGAADGGGFTFEPGGIFRVAATTGVTNFRAVGTNPDLQLGSTTYNNVFYWDFSATTLALIPGTAYVEKVTIGSNTVTTPAGVGRLSVFQGNSVGALPVVHVHQVDVSEEFIRFQGSAAAATLTQSIVAVADVTTATLIGYLKVHVVDDGNQITDQGYYQPIYTLS